MVVNLKTFLYIYIYIYIYIFRTEWLLGYAVPRGYYNITKIGTKWNAKNCNDGNLYDSVSIVFAAGVVQQSPPRRHQFYNFTILHIKELGNDFLGIPDPFFGKENILCISGKLPKQIDTSH
jgi:hypothetical protein